ncbi:MAG TPA: hypothetical protein VN454_11395 [Candidatus Angelobacter sp.]|nr:hypothetical protein [Candidatus Angelobacter sp.]
MKRFSVGCTILLVAAVFFLNSCSGLPGGNTGGGGGTTRLVLTMTDAPPSGISPLASPISIGTLILDSSTSVGVRLVPNGTVVANADLVRLQSDSAFLGSYDVPNAGYKNTVATIATPNLSYLNQTGAAVTENAFGAQCSNNSICFASDPAGFFGGAITLVTGTGLPASFSGSNIATAFDLNQSALITSAPGFVTLDFNQPNALTLVALPRAGVPSGTVDFVEDYIGTVTAVSGNTVTIQPTGSDQFGKPLPLIATANSSTKFDNCTTATIACVHTNQSLSVDASIGTDGSVTLLEVDNLNDTTGDEVEGTIATIDATHQVFVIVVADKLTATNSTDTTFQTQVKQGAPVQVALGSSATFAVDTKGLLVPAANLSTFSGFSSLAPGQTVRVNVSSTGSSTTGTAFNQVTVSNVTLRFSRLTGNISTVVAGNSVFNYDVTTIPALFALTSNPQVQIFPGVTLFDGASDLTRVTAGNSVSIRALFLPSSTPSFFAAKVRKHLP